MDRRNVARRLLALLLLGVLGGSLAPPATGHTSHGGVSMYLVNAHDAETENGTLAWFTIDNGTDANPSPTLHPGQQVRLVLINLGDRNHSLAIGGPIDRTSQAIPPGEETIMSFTVPTDVQEAIPYRDPAYADRGMQGRFDVAGVEETQTTQLLPVVGVVALLGLLAMGGRRRP